MKPPPTQRPFDKIDEMGASPERAWTEWCLSVFQNIKYKGSDTTANRPVNGLNDGDWYLDTTLGQPIWYYSGGWIDATGASV